MALHGRAGFDDPANIDMTALYPGCCLGVGLFFKERQAGGHDTAPMPVSAAPPSPSPLTHRAIRRSYPA